MVDRGEPLQPGPGGPYRGQLPVQPQRGGGRRGRSTDALISSCPLRCGRLRERGGEVFRAMDEHDKAHHRVTEAAEFVALSFISTGSIGLDAQAVGRVRAPRRSCRPAWHPEGVNHVLARDHDVHRRARREVQDVPRSPRRPGRDTGKSRTTAGPRPRSRGGALPTAAAAAARPRPGHRRSAAAGRRPAGRDRRARSSAQATRPSPSPAARPPDTNSPMHQREQHGGAGQHDPPQRSDRLRGRPAGGERRQRPAATGEQRSAARFGSPLARR